MRKDRLKSVADTVSGFEKEKTIDDPDRPSRSVMQVKKNGSIKPESEAPPGDKNFEQVYGKEVDDFLNDSDWEVDSMVDSVHSNKSKRSAMSGKVKGLESIYLQRLEGSKKRKEKRSKMRNRTKGRFRTDRYDELIKDSDSDGSFISGRAP